MNNFEYFNPNPCAETFKSGKPKFWNRDDSSVRAIAKVSNKNWEDIYRKLIDCGEKNHDMPHSKGVVNQILSNFNFDFVTLGKPIVGQKRPTVKEFISEHKNGTYVLYLRNYYLAVIDGISYNTVDMQDEAVYSYWIKKGHS